MKFHSCSLSIRSNEGNNMTELRSIIGLLEEPVNVSAATPSYVNSTENMTTEILSSSPQDMFPDLHFIGYVMVPFLLAVGLCGNCLTVAIIRRSYFLSSTVRIFLIALALSDTTFILTFPFNKQFVHTMLGMDIRALTVSGCKAFFCFFRSAKICSSWLVVAISIERFVVIWVPLKAKLISTTTAGRITVVSIVTVVFIFDGTWSMTTDVINNVCLANVVTPGTKDLAMGFVIAGTVIFSVIPVFILLLLTPLTIVKLLHDRRNRRQMMAPMPNINDDTSRVTLMLLAVTIAYIVMVSPISVVHSVAFFNNQNLLETQVPSIVIFREFAQVLEQMNYAVNFFLYVAINSRFRANLKAFICCT
ncbi:hypothetical protein CHS0354_009848 [Potamilus streckersoni]|uniref:G-protein coupled receptors family 1 profile domain-containing protein n=1 Tax=Potamilus streckersoni TaxID=2493646 RepID=A0AAE0SWI3_9BIVA|nr:hypothetical protein CHS0354_009848 [Potamilus streckersoni]